MRETCYTVMNLGRRRKDFRFSMPPTTLGDYPVFNNPTAFSDTPPRQADGHAQPRSAPTELGVEEKADGFCHGNGLYGLCSSWIDALQILPPQTIEIIIGIDQRRNQDAVKVLGNAISECNSIFKDINVPRSYDLKEEDVGVAAIVVK